MNLRKAIIFSSLLGFTAAADATPVSDRLIQEYQRISGEQANAATGEVFWNQDRAGRSCSSCHGSDPRQAGKHIKTKRTIEPMSPVVNSKRLTDEKKIEKWFKRNCKWTLSRECTASEKANILLWLTKD